MCMRRTEFDVTKGRLQNQGYIQGIYRMYCYTINCVKTMVCTLQWCNKLPGNNLDFATGRIVTSKLAQSVQKEIGYYCVSMSLLAKPYPCLFILLVLAFIPARTESKQGYGLDRKGTWKRSISVVESTVGTKDSFIMSLKLAINIVNIRENRNHQNFYSSMALFLKSCWLECSVANLYEFPSPFCLNYILV